jgi:hypothetical protein
MLRYRSDIDRSGDRLLVTSLMMRQGFEVVRVLRKALRNERGGTVTHFSNEHRAPLTTMSVPRMTDELLDVAYTECEAILRTKLREISRVRHCAKGSKITWVL